MIKTKVSKNRFDLTAKFWMFKINKSSAVCIYLESCKMYFIKSVKLFFDWIDERDAKESVEKINVRKSHAA